MNKNELENQIGKILNELKRGGMRGSKTGPISGPSATDMVRLRSRTKPVSKATGVREATRTPTEVRLKAPLPVVPLTDDDAEEEAESYNDDDDDVSIRSNDTNMSRDSLASTLPPSSRPTNGNWTDSPRPNPPSLSEAARKQAETSARLTKGIKQDGIFGPKFLPVQPTRRLNPNPIPIPVSTHAEVLAAQKRKQETPFGQARRLGLGDYKRSWPTPTEPNFIEQQTINDEKAKVNSEIIDLISNPETTLAHVAETPLSAYDAATRPKTDDDLNPKTVASKTAPMVSSDDFADTSKSILKYNELLKDQFEQNKQQKVAEKDINKANDEQMHQEALVASAQAALADAKAKLAQSEAVAAQASARWALVNAKIADKNLEAGLPVVPEDIKAAADEQVFPPEPPPIYQPSDNIAASAVAFAAAKEAANEAIEKFSDETEAKAVASAAAQERPIIINETAAANALAQAAAQERPIINESAAANALAQAAAQERPAIEEDESAAAQALAQAATQERPIIEEDESAVAQALAQAATQERPIIEEDESAAAQALAQAAAQERPVIEEDESAAANALAQAAAQERPVIEEDESAAAQAIANAAVNEAGPAPPGPDSDQAAAQALANAAVNEAGPAPPGPDSDQAAAQAIARAAVNEAGPAAPAAAPAAAAGPDSDQAAAQAVARAAVNEVSDAVVPPAGPVPAPAPLNLSKAIYDALTGMFPPVNYDVYANEIKGYREKIFAELKPSVSNEKITENIRLILRKPKDPNGFFCVFHIHRDYLEADANKKKLMPLFKLYTADFDGAGAMTNLKIYEDPLKSVTP